jgi:hypothetical protein
MRRLRRRRDASPRLGPKRLAELAWWERALRQRVEWYRGERTTFGRRPPSAAEKQVRKTIEASAGVTTLAVSLDRYPRAVGRSARPNF